MTPIETPLAADASATAALTTASLASASTPTEQPEPGTVQSSAYRDRLNPWCVVRLSEQAPVTVARFRRRPDAEAHLRLLTQAKRDNFAIVFRNPTENTAD